MVTGDATRYDRRVSSGRPWVRLLLIPAVLFVAVSGTVYAVAKAHPASPSVKASTGPVSLGDPYRGETEFQKSCAGCHGEGGKGGGIGPTLAGSGIPLAAAKAQIENGGGTMPAGIVSGQAEADVLAYLEGILSGR